jgi:hypothetical protein
MRRNVLVAAALAVLVAAGGCTRPGEQLGTGPNVGFCDGWAELDALAEPPVDQREKVLRWAEGELRILDRIDTREKVKVDKKERALPVEVVGQLEAIQKDLEVLRDRTRRAETPEGVRRAVADLTRADFDATADRLARAEEVLCATR